MHTTPLVYKRRLIEADIEEIDAIAVGSNGVSATLSDERPEGTTGK